MGIMETSNSEENYNNEYDNIDNESNNSIHSNHSNNSNESNNYEELDLTENINYQIFASLLEDDEGKNISTNVRNLSDNVEKLNTNIEQRLDNLTNSVGAIYGIINKFLKYSINKDKIINSKDNSVNQLMR